MDPLGFISGLLSGAVSDALQPINELICQALVNAAAWMFNLYFFWVDAIGDSSFITGNLSTIFGNTTVWNLVSSVHQTLVIPVGESILALFMLVQLIKISQRIDATSTLPAVKDIVFLAVIYIIMHWLIVNSLDLTQDIYNVFNSMVTSGSVLSGHDGMTDFTSTIDVSGQDWSTTSIGTCFVLVIIAFLGLFTGLLAYIVALVVALARAIQLYVYAMFSPIPIALLGFDETRQMGIGFFKNFAAACLAGVIIMFLLTAYPSIETAIMTGINYGASDETGFISVLINGFIGGSLSGSMLCGLLTFLACSFLLILGLVKSGAWARDVLGG